MLTELKELALKGKLIADTTDNLKFYSLIWDVSLKVSLLVQQEIENHKISGKWN